MNDERQYRQPEQDVNQSACDVKHQETTGPRDNQDQRDEEKWPEPHGVPSRH